MNSSGTYPFTSDQELAIRQSIEWCANPKNDPAPHASMSDLWRDSERGARIPAGYPHRNWIPLAALDGVIGEGFRAVNPPAFVVDGVAFVPEHDFECFVAHSLGRELEIRNAKFLARERQGQETKKRRRSVVYFIQDGESGPIKIGVSSNLRQRLSSLQSARTVKLKVLARLHGNAKRERELHKQFAHLRIMREWFRPEAELLEFIAALGKRAS